MPEDEIDTETDSQVDETPDDTGPDISVYEAAIAERDATIEALNSQVQTLKAHNYTLMTAQTQANTDDTNVISNDVDEPDDVSIDDLFTTKD